MQFITTHIGNIRIGKDHPIVIQSMTNTDTNDIEASVAQCIRIFDAGAELVRLTVQGMKEVESFSAIKESLRQRGYHQPLAADVHFKPKVAEAAAAVADKVRINPGNYTGRTYKGALSYDEEEQKRQTEEIKSRLKPLISICREHGTAIRVGVNHGSLSERILSWYGDTPKGMVESAMEFISVFHEEDFHNIIISLKASDPKMMIYANRLLYKRMMDEGKIFPLHLGVTEAGSEEDGRIISSVGIGSLLTDGIGDTIRVSLTEEPELEIPVAKKIIDAFGQNRDVTNWLNEQDIFHDPYSYRRRESYSTGIIGGENVPVVITGERKMQIDHRFLKEAGYLFREDMTLDIGKRAADFLCAGSVSDELTLLRGLNIISEEKIRDLNHRGIENYRLYHYERFGTAQNHTGFIMIPSDISTDTLKEIAPKIGKSLLVLDLRRDPVGEGRSFFRKLSELGMNNPVILHRKYPSFTTEELMILAAGELGRILIDGFGDGLWLQAEDPETSTSVLTRLSFNILQATGVRISQTAYIACPSCGRTLFNIQETLRKIKDATSEFTGLKIAVMGCIVNGPGEMADADYGYVGAGKGKVSLYKGKKVVRKNIPEEEAVEALLGLIKSERH